VSTNTLGSSLVCVYIGFRPPSQSAVLLSQKDTPIDSAEHGGGEKGRRGGGEEKERRGGGEEEERRTRM
jgi:hypothetical protein